MKTASVYYRKDSVFFRSFSQTTDGVWIGSDSVLQIKEKNNAIEKGETLLKALSDSIQGIPHPTSWGNIDDDPLFVLAGVKSWSTFVKGTLLVGVEMNEQMIIFIPHRNEGPKEGFDPLEDRKIEIPVDSSPQKIGDTLLEASKRCL